MSETNLKPFFKFANGYACQATPLYDGSYDNTVFVMSYKDQYWFDLEVRGIKLLEGKSYSPEIIDVDPVQKKITFKWYDTNLNHMLHYNKPLPKDWIIQIKEILEDLENSNIFKLNIYPHTFYLKNDKVCVMDLYACLLIEDKITSEVLEGVINNKSRFPIKDNILDIKYAYDYTITNNIGEWPGDFLNA
jgi:hypothetical protein